MRAPDGSGQHLARESLPSQRVSQVYFREGSELADGRYRLERRLGSGGMATVWLALDTRLARSVAIKLPSEALASDDTFAIRFEREAQTAAALSHPHLVSVFDYGTEGDRPYLVSEYIDGLNLAQLRDRVRAPETEALARTLLEALAHIHRAGIVHRDVKPGNVLVDREGKVLLTDFGIAQSTEETSLTAAGHVVGTLSYLAPEVKRGGRAGPESDLYSLGVLLSEQLDEEDPDRVRRLIGALTQEDPADRPADAERALEMLERQNVVVAPTAQIEIEQPTAVERVRREAPQSRPFTTPPPAPTRSSGSRSRLIAGGLAALVLGVGAAVVIASTGGDDDRGKGATTVAKKEKKKPVPETSTTETSTVTEATTSTVPVEPATPDPKPAKDDVVAGDTDPARGAELNNEGFALLQQGDVEGALPKLQEAVSLFPEDSTEIDYAYALFNYAQALRLSGDPADAIPLLEKRLSFSDFRVDDVKAELTAAQKAAG